MFNPAHVTVEMRRDPPKEVPFRQLRFGDTFRFAALTQEFDSAIYCKSGLNEAVIIGTSLDRGSGLYVGRIGGFDLDDMVIEVSLTMRVRDV